MILQIHPIIIIIIIEIDIEIVIIINIITMITGRKDKIMEKIIITPITIIILNVLTKVRMIFLIKILSNFLFIIKEMFNYRKIKIILFITLRYFK